MEQPELWASETRSKVLRVSIERAWARGENAYDLSVSAVGSRNPEPIWVSTDAFDGEHAALVVRHVVEAHVARFQGALWKSPLAGQGYEKWLKHLTTF